MRAEEDMISWDKLEPTLDQLSDDSMHLDMEKIYKLLNKLVPQFNPKSNVTDD